MKERVKMLPKEAYLEYKAIYKSEFGIELSDEEAIKQAHDMLSLFRVLIDTKKAIASKGNPGQNENI